MYFLTYVCVGIHTYETCRYEIVYTVMKCSSMYSYMTVYIVICFSCSVTKWCSTLCDRMNYGTPGFPVLHYLLEFAQTQVHWVDDALQPSHPLSLPSPHALNLSQHQSFPLSWLFASGGQIIGTSASASVLPMSIQG